MIADPALLMSRCQCFLAFVDDSLGLVYVSATLELYRSVAWFGLCRSFEHNGSLGRRPRFFEHVSPSLMLSLPALITPWASFFAPFAVSSLAAPAFRWASTAAPRARSMSAALACSTQLLGCVSADAICRVCLLSALLLSSDLIEYPIFSVLVSRACISSCL